MTDREIIHALRLYYKRTKKTQSEISKEIGLSLTLTNLAIKHSCVSKKSFDKIRQFAIDNNLI
jgi:hypothetical protein